jgi:hypothetical protein
MRIRRLAVACAAALAASMSASYAGPCSDDINNMRVKIDDYLHAKAAAGPRAPPGAMVGVAQPTSRSLATVEERMGEISPQAVNAVEQAMARARAADATGDKVACEQALAEVQRALDQ